MCGIAGFLTRSESRDAERKVRAMTDAIAHRGPDDAGCHVAHYDDPALTVALGHRRLSIIDLSPAGHQPMQSSRGEDLWIVFNGEVYNFLEVRKDLEARGFAFRSATDTEVILAAYEAWGVECVARLDGMFAFAIWDGRERRLFLARDRIGKKPLLYRLASDGIAFASELTALTTLSDVDRRFDEQALAGYFTLGFVPGERTVFSAVRKLPPGCYAMWRDGDWTCRPYWEVVPHLRSTGGSSPNEEAVLDELDARLRASVRKRLISDVPLGAWLSGGIDSSLVVAEMCAAQGGDVRTFTIGFDDEAHDESGVAQAVAAHFGTRHEVFRISAAELLAAVPDVAGVYDEPFADTAGVPTYVLSRLSRRQVTVALCGDGGDEGFMGYLHYRQGRVLDALQRVPRAVRRSAAAVAGRFGGLRWRQRARTIAFDDWAALYVSLTSSLRAADGLQVVPYSFLLDGTIYRRVAEALEGRDALTMLTALDLSTTLPDKFLVKVDRAAMSVGLEVRAPFLDHHLIAWAVTLPATLKLRGGVTKYLLRRLLRRKLPHALVERPKCGFSPPMGRWLREDLADWVRDTLAPRRVRDTGILNERAVTSLVDAHLSGRAELGTALWMLLCFMTWHARVFGPSSTACAPAVPAVAEPS